MNICLFSRIINEHGVSGGMEIYGEIICQGFLQRGHSITIITGEHPNGKEFEVDGEKKIYYLTGVSPYKYTKNWWYRSVEKFKEIHKRENFDIIWSQGGGALSWLKYCRRYYNIPCIATIHGTTFNEVRTGLKNISSIDSLLKVSMFFFKAIYYKLKWEQNWPFLSAAIVVSRELGKVFQRECSVDPKRMFFIPNGVNTEKFRPLPDDEKQKLREKYHINNDEKILLIIGKIEHQKGIHIAIKALAKTLKMFNNLKLIVVGEGNYLDRLKKLVGQIALKDKVIFHGYVQNENLVYYYSLCDVFLMPTLRIEGFPVVLPEAMACQKPIIASRIGGIPSAIDDRVNGILIPLGDVDALVEKIILLLKNEDLSQRLSKNAREKAVKEFSQEKMIMKTLEVFEKCITSKRDGSNKAEESYSY